MAGEWHGSGRTARGKKFSLKLIIKEDGSYRAITKRSGDSNDDTGTMHLLDGTFWFRSTTNGQIVIVTLDENKKGKRQLKGWRPGGMTWKVKPAKK